MSKQVLVVDDEPDMRKVLRFALTPIGGLIEASNGPEALRLVKVHRPRLILLDVTMPGMGGIEVLKAVHALNPKIIVVMLTGLSDIEIAKEALDNGARAYITKPFDDDYLCAEVRRLLEERDEKGDADDECPWHVKPS